MESDQTGRLASNGPRTEARDDPPVEGGNCDSPTKPVDDGHVDACSLILCRLRPNVLFPMSQFCPNSFVRGTDLVEKAELKKQTANDNGPHRYTRAHFMPTPLALVLRREWVRQPGWYARGSSKFKQALRYWNTS